MVADRQPSTLTEVFEQVFPYYLSIGMTYGQFWHGDPKLARFYREAEYMRLQREQTAMWYNGIYMRSAIASSISFGKKSPPKYLDKPLDVVPKTKAQKEAEVIRERQKIIDYFNMMKLNWRKRGGNSGRD